VATGPTDYASTEDGAIVVQFAGETTRLSVDEAVRPLPSVVMPCAHLHNAGLGGLIRRFPESSESNLNLVSCLLSLVSGILNQRSDPRLCEPSKCPVGSRDSLGNPRYTRPAGVARRPTMGLTIVFIIVKFEISSAAAPRPHGSYFQAQRSEV